jgi:hypothetical protein
MHHTTEKNERMVGNSYRLGGVENAKGEGRYVATQAK